MKKHAMPQPIIERIMSMMQIIKLSVKKIAKTSFPLAPIALSTPISLRLKEMLVAIKFIIISAANTAIAMPTYKNEVDNTSNIEPKL